jgi:hypothetical protein
MTGLARNVIALGVFGLLGAAGCSPADQGTVSGEVTLDGQPLKEGVIRFGPADGKSQPASAAIVNGRFSATMAVGKKRVEISAPKVTGKKIKMYDSPESPRVDMVTELLPARYNVRSELTITVGAGGQQERFELKSK